MQHVWKVTITYPSREQRRTIGHGTIAGAIRGVCEFLGVRVKSIKVEAVVAETDYQCQDISVAGPRRAEV